MVEGNINRGGRAKEYTREDFKRIQEVYFKTAFKTIQSELIGPRSRRINWQNDQLQLTDSVLSYIDCKDIMPLYVQSGYFGQQSKEKFNVTLSMANEIYNQFSMPTQYNMKIRDSNYSVVGEFVDSLLIGKYNQLINDNLHKKETISKELFEYVYSEVYLTILKNVFSNFYTTEVAPLASNIDENENLDDISENMRLLIAEELQANLENIQYFVFRLLNDYLHIRSESLFKKPKL